MSVSYKRWSWLALGIALLALVSCAPLPTVTPEPEGGLAGTSWTLISFGQPESETPVVEGSTVTITFDAEGRAGGSGGCNTYSGSYELTGDNTVSFGEMVRTEMACLQEGIDQQENDYLEALSAAGKFELDGDNLTIWYDGEQGILNFVRGTES